MRVLDALLILSWLGITILSVIKLQKKEAIEAAYTVISLKTNAAEWNLLFSVNVEVFNGEFGVQKIHFNQYQCSNVKNASL